MTADGTPESADPAQPIGPAPAPAPHHRRRRLVLLVAAAVVVAVVATGAVVVGLHRPAPVPVAATHRLTSTPTPSPTPTLAGVPAAPGADALAALPSAFYDAVIPGLLDGTSVTPTASWQIAAPKQPLVALYASPAADAAPIATLGATVPTLDTPTVTAVWGSSPGQDGGMLLVSTPSRNRTPGDGGVADAPSATFAWARAADLTITPVEQMIRVDTGTGTISVVDRAGTTSASETARLGTASDPTPVQTSTYMEANYVDERIAYTQGHPIALTGAHSSLLTGYGGNSALTALHFYPDPTGSSHGCVRISAAMTATLAGLPVGTPIQFT